MTAATKKDRFTTINPETKSKEGSDNKVPKIGVRTKDGVNCGQQRVTSTISEATHSKG